MPVELNTSLCRGGGRVVRWVQGEPFLSSKKNGGKAPLQARLGVRGGERGGQSAANNGRKTGRTEHADGAEGPPFQASGKGWVVRDRTTSQDQTEKAVGDTKGSEGECP